MWRIKESVIAMANDDTILNTILVEIISVKYKHFSCMRYNSRLIPPIKDNAERTRFVPDISINIAMNIRHGIAASVYSRYLYG